MGKVTTLPLAGPLDGTEPVMVIQDGEARQAPIGDLVEELAQPFVDEADAIMAGIDATAVSAAVSRQQLFNPAAATDGYFVSAAGGLSVNVDYFASDWMAWGSATQAALKWANWLVQGTKTGDAYTAIAGTHINPDSAGYVLNKAAGATHFRVSGQKSHVTIANQMVVRGPTLPADYVSFNEITDGSTLRKNSVSGASLVDQSVTTQKAAFLELGKNLFDKSKRTLDSVQSTAGVGANTSYDLTDYINVAEGDVIQYHSPAGGARFRACFNSAGANVSTESTISETSSYTVPVGSGVTKIRLSIAKARIDGFQVEKAAAPTGFEPFGFRFTGDIVGMANADQVSAWKDKVAISYGDSITFQQAWQPAIASELGLVHTAYGVGGRQISGTAGMNVQATIDALPASLDLLMVLGGTNDWAQSRVLGAVNSTNIEEFFGGLNVMIQRLATRYPAKRIVMCATPYGEMPGRLIPGHANYDAGWTSADLNEIGLSTRDYAEAVRIAAMRWGLPVIDFGECGWNSVNIATYMVDDTGGIGGGLHPNAAGGARMAEIGIGKLRSIEPLA